MSCLLQKRVGDDVIYM